MQDRLSELLARSKVKPLEYQISLHRIPVIFRITLAKDWRSVPPEVRPWKGKRVPSAKIDYLGCCAKGTMGRGTKESPMKLFTHIVINLGTLCADRSSWYEFLAVLMHEASHSADEIVFQGLKRNMLKRPSAHRASEFRALLVELHMKLFEGWMKDNFNRMEPKKSVSVRGIPDLSQYLKGTVPWKKR